GRRANVTIGRAIGLTLVNGLPELAGLRNRVMGNAAQMAGMVIAEKEDTPWEPLSVLLGFPPEASTVTAFSTFQGSPLQILPLGDRFRRAITVANLYAEAGSEGWCGPGTRLLLLAPTAQRPFLEEGWSKEDLRAYLRENTRISVADLKRRRRWLPGPGESPTEEGSAPISREDESRYLSVTSGELAGKLAMLPNEPAPASATADFLPVVAGSEVAHLYTYLFEPYPIPPPSPVTKLVRAAGAT